MPERDLLYGLTFAGLYLELAGAFLLSIEAIGFDHLERLGEGLRKHRVLSFLILLAAAVALLAMSKLGLAIHLAEAMILICSIALVSDFGPKMLGAIVHRLEKGTAGAVGFLLFALGFSLQAYVNLSLLY
ncbi:MAG: hypothetical protein CME06_01690 [Gemmatimonadetes bacterium]|nr:hypothetical protein [Gemmatimonadota bacterium]